MLTSVAPVRAVWPSISDYQLLNNLLLITIGVLIQFNFHKMNFSYYIKH